MDKGKINILDSIFSELVFVQ